MNAVANFILEHQNFILTIWYITFGGMVLFYIAANHLPDKWISRILPFHVAFEPIKNIDLDFQTQGYQMVHTQWFNRITHYTIFLDATLWFVVAFHIHWLAVALVIGICIVQAGLVKERYFAFFFLISVFGSAGTAFLMGQFFDPQLLYLCSVMFLMFSGILRVIGHTPEKLPPTVLEDSDKFVKLSSSNLNWRVPIMGMMGYFAEFSSGMPFRLFAVQVNYLYQMIFKIKPKNTQSLDEMREEANKMLENGITASPKFERYYHRVAKK